MDSFSTHDRFFSSLSQVEKRLASERNPTVLPPVIHSSSDPLASPLYLDQPQPLAGVPRPPHHQDSSGPPWEFLSSSSQQHPSPLTQHEQDPPAGDDGDPADDIERLMHLLGLSAEGEEGGANGGTSCDCSGAGFYSRIAGVKGPRCDREMRRLNGWIEYYSGCGGGRREPARLAHLLLAKAACSTGGDDEDVEFPLTVEEFLDHDPPQKKET